MTWLDKISLYWQKKRSPHKVIVSFASARKFYPTKSEDDPPEEQISVAPGYMVGFTLHTIELLMVS